MKALISSLKNTIALDFFHSKEGDVIFWTDVVDDKIYKGTLLSGGRRVSSCSRVMEDRGNGFGLSLKYWAHQDSCFLRPQRTVTDFGTEIV